jgi:predicted enzyme related to lactoylglutathione lyase
MKSGIKFQHAGLLFPVKDVVEAMKFYWDVLGFDVDYEDGTPPHYAVVCRDEVYIHLCLKEAQLFEIGPGCGFISVAGVDELWSHVQSIRAEIFQTLEERDFGHGVVFKVFTMKDPDGNVLRIGQAMDAKS